MEEDATTETVKAACARLPEHGAGQELLKFAFIAKPLAAELGIRRLEYGSFAVEFFDHTAPTVATEPMAPETPEETAIRLKADRERREKMRTRSVGSIIVEREKST